MSIEISREVTLECFGSCYHAHYRHIGNELKLVSGFTHVTSELAPCNRALADAAARELLTSLVEQGRAWRHRG